MKIFGDHRSGNCDKVRFAIDYLGLPYDWIEIDSVQGGTRSDDFLAINPQGQIPLAIFEDGRILAQSNAILRYIAAGSELVPEDAWKRAKVDEWMFWEANNHEFFVSGCIAHMTYMGKSKDTRDGMRVKRGEAALDIMEQRLRVTNWIVEDEFTIADVALLAYTRRAHLGGFEMTARAKVREWVARCEAVLGVSSL